MPIDAAVMASALAGERELRGESADAHAGEDGLGGNHSSGPDNSSSAPLNTHETVIKPRRTVLSALDVTDEAPMSIPSLEDSKVGPHNFEKIRLLGAGATGKVYLVKSIVRLRIPPCVLDGVRLNSRELTTLVVTTPGSAHRGFLCDEGRQEE